MQKRSKPSGAKPEKEEKKGKKRQTATVDPAAAGVAEEPPAGAAGAGMLDDPPAEAPPPSGGRYEAETKEFIWDVRNNTRVKVMRQEACGGRTCFVWGYSG